MSTNPPDSSAVLTVVRGLSSVLNFKVVLGKEEHAPRPMVR
jgi:hypothetical protein